MKKKPKLDRPRLWTGPIDTKREAEQHAVYCRSEWPERDFYVESEARPRWRVMSTLKKAEKKAKKKSTAEKKPKPPKSRSKKP